MALSARQRKALDASCLMRVLERCQPSDVCNVSRTNKATNALVNRYIKHLPRTHVKIKFDMRTTFYSVSYAVPKSLAGSTSLDILYSRDGTLKMRSSEFVSQHASSENIINRCRYVAVDSIGLCNCYYTGPVTPTPAPQFPSTCSVAYECLDHDGCVNLDSQLTLVICGKFPVPNSRTPAFTSTEATADLNRTWNFFQRLCASGTEKVDFPVSQTFVPANMHYLEVRFGSCDPRVMHMPSKLRLPNCKLADVIEFAAAQQESISSFFPSAYALTINYGGYFFETICQLPRALSFIEWNLKEISRGVQQPYILGAYLYHELSSEEAIAMIENFMRENQQLVIVEELELDFMTQRRLKITFRNCVAQAMLEIGSDFVHFTSASSMYDV